MEHVCFDRYFLGGGGSLKDSLTAWRLPYEGVGHPPWADGDEEVICGLEKLK